MESGRGGKQAIPVAKSWIKTDGRQFLIEAVEFPIIAPLLQQLQQAAAPARQKNAQARKPAKSRQEMARAFPLPAAPKKQEQRIMRVASAPVAGPMVVVDYQTLNSSLTNYVFR
jgi:hypothetical protein